MGGSLGSKGALVGQEAGFVVVRLGQFARKGVDFLSQRTIVFARKGTKMLVRRPPVATFAALLRPLLGALGATGEQLGRFDQHERDDKGSGCDPRSHEKHRPLVASLRQTKRRRSQRDAKEPNRPVKGGDQTSFVGLGRSRHQRIEGGEHQPDAKSHESGPGY